MGFSRFLKDVREYTRPPTPRILRVNVKISVVAERGYNESVQFSIIRGGMEVAKGVS